MYNIFVNFALLSHIICYFFPSDNFFARIFYPIIFFSHILSFFLFILSTIFFSLFSLLLISNTILDSPYIHTLLLYHLHSISCTSILTLLPPFLLLYHLPFPSHSFSLRVSSRTYLNLYSYQSISLFRQPLFVSLWLTETE